MAFKQRNSVLFLLVLLCLVFSAQIAFAQLPADSVKQKPEWIYGFDNRRTHIQQQGTLIYGAYTGVGFRNRLRLKIGISGTPFEVGRYTDELGNAYFNRLLFFNIGQEYDYLIWKKYRMTAYTQIGYGANNYRITNPETGFNGTGHAVIVPLELGTHFNYFVVDWLAIKIGGGWRFVFPTDINDLSGYYLKLALGMNVKKFCVAYQKWKVNRTATNNYNY